MDLFYTLFNVCCEYNITYYAFVRNNTNFIRGYEKSQRLQNVDDEFFKKGAEAYLAGIPWDEINDNYKENVSFVFGYEDAMTMSSGKRR